MQRQDVARVPSPVRERGRVALHPRRIGELTASEATERSGGLEAGLQPAARSLEGSFAARYARTSG
ncbi:hypothetical protein EBB05_08855 [Methylobacterium brachiatum]|nr:hypothetical protein EBB05_08855 [Methylobacterium brachiatum]